MGVTGLWRLIEPSGKPVPLETLENKVLAVDVSIWLHQAIKGFRDAKGGSIPNAHLLGIYHRVCKLLYFKIKPVFVFDGGVPNLKKETIAKRNQIKTKTINAADNIQKQLLDTLLKHSAVSKVIAERVKNKIETENSPPKSKKNTEELYLLPARETELDSTLSSDECDESSEIDSSPTKHWNLHTIDEKSSYFKSLPADVRHEILTDLKETRKQSSWGIIHQMPKESGDFSKFQMRRLLKRYSIQASLEEAEKEMGGHSLSLAELESLLTAQGVVTTSETIGSTIASDENTRYLYIKDVKQALENARRQEDDKNNEESNQDDKISSSVIEVENQPDLEYEKDLEKAIELSLQDVPSSSKSFLNQSQIELLSSSSESSDEADLNVIQPVVNSAKSYMTEYSGLTPYEIEKIMGTSKTKPKNVTREVHAEKETLPETTKEENRVQLVPQEETSEIMSDSDSSDLCEVTSTEIDSNNVLEVIIKPDNPLEDDIFSDIFSNKEQEEPTDNKVHKNAETEVNLSNLQENIEPITKDVISEGIPEELPTTSNKVIEIKKVNDDNTTVPKKPTLTTQDLINLEKDINKESLELRAQKLSKERIGTDLTDQVYQEAQELLELFGIPYIVAPMEAEAQCGFLDCIGLTDGTITDDSDIWLFGGKTVYKNFFDQQKLVLQFKAEDIKHCFKLTREQLILLALLVGSDYTTGLQGVGPVTALEILSTFPPVKKSETLKDDELLTGLEDFRKWLKDSNAASKAISLRSKLKNVTVSESFPSLNVTRAYLEPQIDSSKRPFSWAKPHVPLLIDFAKEKFGWTQTKSESILKPVLKRLEDSQVQKSIKDYFKTKHVVSVDASEIKMSKRVRKAIENFDKTDGETEPKRSKGKKKREVKKPTNLEKTKANSTRSKPTRGAKRKNGAKIEEDGSKQDDDIEVLKQTLVYSQAKVKEVEDEVKKTIEEKPKATRITVDFHKKETIPQKERDKSVALRTKLKAIEVFRKSKLGSIKKRQKKFESPKADAELSESSSSSD